MEVLNTYTEYNEFISLLVPFAGFLAFIFLVFCIGNIIKKSKENAVICLVFFLITGFLTSGLIDTYFKSGKECLEVVISDYNKVDLNKYKIISQRGKITILKEIK